MRTFRYLRKNDSIRMLLDCPHSMERQPKKSAVLCTTPHFDMSSSGIVLTVYKTCVLKSPTQASFTIGLPCSDLQKLPSGHSNFSNSAYLKSHEYLQWLESRNSHLW